MGSISRMKFYLLLVAGFVLWVDLKAQTGTTEPLVLPRITGPIVIDGIVDEPAWVAIDPVPLISYDPVSGLPPSEATQIRIAYADQYIAASIPAYDSHPAANRANPPHAIR